MLHPHPAIHHLLRLLQLFILVGAAALFFRFLFPPLLPLTAAFVLSALICRPVDALWKRFPLPRGLWAVLVILGALGILFLTGWMIWRMPWKRAVMRRARNVHATRCCICGLRTG